MFAWDTSKLREGMIDGRSGQSLVGISLTIELKFPSETTVILGSPCPMTNLSGLADIHQEIVMLCSSVFSPA
jgi:hypothetical protein